MYNSLMILFMIVFGGTAALSFIMSLHCFLKGRTDKSGKKSLIWLATGAVSLCNAVAVIWHGSYTRFGFLNLSYLAFFVMLGILAVQYIKSERQIKIANYCFSGIFALFVTIRLFYPIPFYHRIPLNICNIATLFIIARPFFKSKTTDGYMLFFIFAGILMNVLLGEFHGKGVEFFFYEGFISNTLHSFFIVYLMFFFRKNSFTVTKKATMMNIAWILPFYILLIFLNQIFEYNYFFTSIHRNPILFFYNMFPVFSVAIGGRAFEFNIGFYISLLIIVMTLLFLSTCLLQWLGKRMGGNKPSRVTEPKGNKWL